MGVRGLWRLLDCFGEVVHPEALRGQRVAIDASVWIFQFRSAAGLSDNEEERILEGFLQRILKLLFYGIEPVFVFDGVSSSSKAAEQHRRRLQRLETRRTFLFRRAREIVAAQQASGALRGSELSEQSKSRSSPRPRPAPTLVARIQEEKARLSQMILEGNEVAPAPAPRAKPVKPSRKRHRGEAVPQQVSMALTSRFLEDAAEFLQDRKAGEERVSHNVLRMSSTALFMGPRDAVQASVTVPPGNELSSQKASSPTPIAVQSDTPIEVLSDRSDSMAQLRSSAEILTHTSEEEEEVDSRVSTSVELVRDGRERDGAVETEPEAVEVVATSGEEEKEWTRIAKSESVRLCGSSDTSSVALESSEAEEEPSSSQDTKDRLWLPFTQVGPLCEDRNAVIAQNSGIFKDWDSEKQEKADDTTEPPPHPHTSVWSSPGAAAVARTVPFDLLGIVELLDCCGVPFVLSPCEADAQCACLSRQCMVDAVFTEDSDVVVHGAKAVLRGFFSGSKDVVRYEQVALEACGLTKPVLVALAMLLGCDYDEGLSGVGITGALDILLTAWIPGSSVSSDAAVLALLQRWKALVQAELPQSLARAEEDMSLLQFHLLQQHHAAWRQLSVMPHFPSRHVTDAFFHPTVEEQCEPFQRRAPDWGRLKFFANSRSLLSSRPLMQRFLIVQSAFEKESQRQEQAANERRITDYGAPTPRSVWKYKKQSGRQAVQLEVLKTLQSYLPSL